MTSSPIWTMANGEFIWTAKAFQAHNDLWGTTHCYAGVCALMLAAANCALINQESWRVGRLCGLLCGLLSSPSPCGPQPVCPRRLETRLDLVNAIRLHARQSRDAYSPRLGPERSAKGSLSSRRDWMESPSTWQSAPPASRRPCRVKLTILEARHGTAGSQCRAGLVVRLIEQTTQEPCISAP